MSYLNSILNYSKKFDSPFVHWELNKPLTDEQITEIVGADITDPAKPKLIKQSVFFKFFFAIKDESMFP